jgi:hypothetical protein
MEVKEMEIERVIKIEPTRVGLITLKCDGSEFIFEGQLTGQYDLHSGHFIGKFKPYDFECLRKDKIKNIIRELEKLL